MNVRKSKWLRRKSFVGKILRLPFRIIPGSQVLRIFSGPLKGFRWIKGSHNLSVVIGTYERHQTDEFRKAAASARLFWDLGAHVGYYSLLFRSINSKGMIEAFEPYGPNSALFLRHMLLNNATNVNLHKVAVSNAVGTLSFKASNASVSGKLSEGGSESVDVVKLSEWMRERKIGIPDLIKMDIEGEELKVLTDLQDLLKTHKPVLFLSTHGSEVHKKCLEFLKTLDYAFKPLDSQEVDHCNELLVY